MRKQGNAIFKTKCPPENLPVNSDRTVPFSLTEIALSAYQQTVDLSLLTAS